MTTQGVGAQRLANPRVRAGHDHGGAGPVTNMAPRRCKHLHRLRARPLEHVRQVADHATGSFGQSQLYGLVQLPDDLTEPAGKLQDHYLTYGVCSNPSMRSCGRKAG